MHSRRRPRRPAASFQIRPEGCGFAAEGPGFYVWDHDRREVERATREYLGRRLEGSSGPFPRRAALLPLVAPRAEALDL